MDRTEQKFSKSAILKYEEKYYNQKDLLNALLKDDTFYSLEEVEMILDKYLKGDVS